MLVTLAERPDLASATYAIPYPPDSPEFMAGSLASLLVRGSRVARRWPHLVVALLEGDRPVARGIMVPFRGRGSLPDRGWDEVAVWAAEDALDDVVPDTACALEIAVHPSHRGRGHSRTVQAGMRAAALGPVFVSTAQDFAVYVEANVWVSHRVDQSAPAPAAVLTVAARAAAVAAVATARQVLPVLQHPGRAFPLEERLRPLEPVRRRVDGRRSAA